MDSKDKKIRLLAQAVYEMRLLLAHHLGSPSPSAPAEKVAAHLSYALHNDALAILEKREEEFSIEKTIETLNHLDQLFGNDPHSCFKNVIHANKT